MLIRGPHDFHYSIYVNNRSAFLAIQRDLIAREAPPQKSSRPQFFRPHCRQHSLCFMHMDSGCLWSPNPAHLHTPEDDMSDTDGL